MEPKKVLGVGVQYSQLAKIFHWGFVVLFAYGIAKSDKTVKESIDIADDLFVLLMKRNGLNPNSMFDDQNLIKESIRSETIERVDKCKEWTKEAIPKIVLERTGKEATLEFINGATKTFGFWWLGTLEQIKGGK